MTIAFLYHETYPNYALDMTVLKEIDNLKRGKITSYVFSGLWYFLQNYQGQQNITDKKVMDDITKVFFGGDGNIASIYVSHKKFLDTVLDNKIYVCMLSGIDKFSAREIHTKLKNNNNYVGFTQVLPTSIKHHKLFYPLIPRYKLENNKVGVLYADENDEDAAVDIVDYVNQKYTSVEDWSFREKFFKKCIGDKFTIFDTQDSSKLEYQKQKALIYLQDENEIIINQVTESLSDFSPDALDELLTAINVLENIQLNETHCAHIGVSLRRCIEILTKEIFDDVDTTKNGWVQNRWAEFSKEEKDQIEKIRNKILFDEIKEVLNVADKTKSLFQLGNKSVHESVLISYYKKLLLRVVLTIDDILDIFVLKRKVKADYSMFSYEYLD